MDKTNLKSLKAVGLDLLDLAGKLQEVAETLDTIVASETKLVKAEATKKEKIIKAVKEHKPVKTKNAIEDKPKAKLGRPAKAK